MQLNNSLIFELANKPINQQKISFKEGSRVDWKWNKTKKSLNFEFQVVYSFEIGKK